MHLMIGENAMREILRVGTSAGGARAKAIIAWNEQTGDIRSGPVEPGRTCRSCIRHGILESRRQMQRGSSADPASGTASSAGDCHSASPMVR